MTQQLN